MIVVPSVHAPHRDVARRGDRRHHLFGLRGHDELIDCFKQILRRPTRPDDEHFWRLRGAGLVRRHDDIVVPRCLLYDRYFRKRLDV